MPATVDKKGIPLFPLKFMPLFQAGTRSAKSEWSAQSERGFVRIPKVIMEKGACVFSHPS